jgi:hypothetical protein
MGGIHSHVHVNEGEGGGGGGGQLGHGSGHDDDGNDDGQQRKRQRVGQHRISDSGSDEYSDAEVVVSDGGINDDDNEDKPTTTTTTTPTPTNTTTTKTAATSIGVATSVPERGGDEVVIDYSEFLAATLRRNQFLREERLQYAFSIFDKDGNGSISVAELVEVMGSVEHAREVMGHRNRQQRDRRTDCGGGDAGGDLGVGDGGGGEHDSDGEISYEEFKTMMAMSHNHGHVAVGDD